MTRHGVARLVETLLVYYADGTLENTSSLQMSRQSPLKALLLRRSIVLKCFAEVVRCAVHNGTDKDAG